MSEAMMTAPDARPDSGAPGGPVGHTHARHVALATVETAIVSYDREHAAWTVRLTGTRTDRAVRGAEQRTLRDLTDAGLIETREQPGSKRARLTPRGRAALTLWGPLDERLHGADPE